VLVQLGTSPRVLPYVVLCLLFAIAFAGAYWMPEPIEKRGRFRLTAERPSVPAVLRRPFFLAALAVISSWSIVFAAAHDSIAAYLAGSIRGGAGVVVAHVALATTFEIFGSVVAAIALTVAFEAWRTRPTRPLAA
jgi:hypothetical protein